MSIDLPPRQATTIGPCFLRIRTDEWSGASDRRQSDEIAQLPEASESIRVQIAVGLMVAQQMAEAH
jgi:hypothetical protein